MSLILLIDDDRDMLAITSRWLTKAGHEVQEAGSGSEALAFLEGNTPDLILIDYAMPEMDGPTVLQKIRAMDHAAAIPVYFRTGMDDGSVEDRLTELQADGIVPKSEGKPGLMQVVQQVLGQ